MLDKELSLATVDYQTQAARHLLAFAELFASCPDVLPQELHDELDRLGNVSEAFNSIRKPNKSLVTAFRGIPLNFVNITTKWLKDSGTTSSMMRPSLEKALLRARPSTVSAILSQPVAGAQVQGCKVAGIESFLQHKG